MYVLHMCLDPFGSVAEDQSESEHSVYRRHEASRVAWLRAAGMDQHGSRHGPKWLLQPWTIMVLEPFGVCIGDHLNPILVLHKKAVLSHQSS